MDAGVEDCIPNTTRFIWSSVPKKVLQQARFRTRFIWSLVPKKVLQQTRFRIRFIWSLVPKKVLQHKRSAFRTPIQADLSLALKKIPFH